MSFTTREQTIRAYCALSGLVYHLFADHSLAEDGFCDACPGSRSPEWAYRNEGRVFDYIRRATEEALVRDGVLEEVTTPRPDFEPRRRRHAEDAS